MLAAAQAARAPLCCPEDVTAAMVAVALVVDAGGIVGNEVFFVLGFRRTACADEVLLLLKVIRKIRNRVEFAHDDV